ncbi:MAG: hypothetical protein JWO80_5240 [Bryobacterales bacterium]|nr:hypothetical protein [Bryobacterales bacterium]
MSLSSIAFRCLSAKSVGLPVGALASSFNAQASMFSASLSVSVGFPAVGALPANVSVAAGPGSGAAGAALPNCVVNVLIPPAGGLCNNPADSYLAPVGAPSTLTFTAGPISGSATGGGAVAASSMGMSEEVILGNLNPFAVALPLNLSYTANLMVSAGAMEFSTATYSFSVTNNGAGILPGGPNTFTLNCSACGTMSAANPVPLPPNPVMVMILRRALTRVSPSSVSTPRSRAWPSATSLSRVTGYLPVAACSYS